MRKHKSLEVFRKGIIRAGTALTSIIPSKQRVIKLRFSSLREIKKQALIIKKINEVSNRVELEDPIRYWKIANGIVVLETRLLSMMRFVPSPRNFLNIIKEVYNFSKKLEAKNLCFFSPNFNYGNCFINKKKIRFVGI